MDKLRSMQIFVEIAERRSPSRKLGSPRRSKICRIFMPAAASTSVSESTKGRPSCAASVRPTLLFPEPGMPTMTSVFTGIGVSGSKGFAIAFMRRTDQNGNPRPLGPFPWSKELSGRRQAVPWQQEKTGKERAPMRLAIAGLGFLIVLAAGGVAVLANVSVAPPIHKVEQAVPDDHFPR